MRFFVAGFFLLLALAIAPRVRGAESASRFSHKTHAPLRMACTKCHSMDGKGGVATYPGEAECKVCHTRFTAAQTTFPTVRVYRLPDFVFFSHRVHTDAKAPCARCHGDVAASDTVTLEVPLFMKMCVDCHRETKAPIDCFVCHEISQ